MSRNKTLEDMKMQLNRIEHYIRINTEKKFFPPDPPECKADDAEPQWMRDRILDDPAPPLRAQVAKALGKEIYSPDCSMKLWMCDPVDYATPGLSKAALLGRSELIPPYDTDIKLAMEALIDYCTQCDHTDFTIDWHKGDFQIEIAGGGNVTVYFNEYVLMPLSEIICRAIVKHANQ